MKNSDLNKEGRLVRLLTTIIIGMAGGLIFSRIHAPLPWLLGPMAALLIACRFIRPRLYWSPNIRNLGLVIIGYTLGSSINRETLFQIVQQLPWMLVMTAALIAFSVAAAVIMSRLTGLDFPSVLIGNIPGALTQMTTMGEEIEGADVTVITFLQVVRVILVVFCVPLIIFSPIYSVTVSGLAPVVRQAAAVPLHELAPTALLFTVIALFLALAGKRLKLPTPFLLGPILGISILSIAGLHGPKTSRILLDIAQFSVGSYLGLMMKPEKIQNKAKIVTLAFINGLITIFFSLGLSYILIKLHGIEPATSFLSTSPGGADQMGLIASVISADVSMVTGYQVFRMLSVNFVVPPLLRRFCIYHLKNSQSSGFERGDIQG